MDISFFLPEPKLPQQAAVGLFNHSMFDIKKDYIIKSEIQIFKKHQHSNMEFNPRTA